MGNFLAGVSRVTITPPVGMYLIGMERSDVSHGLQRQFIRGVLLSGLKG